jgi:serine/threonine-protein kinase
MLVWVDREGRATPFLEEPARYSYPRLSPDGKRAAVVKVSENQSDIWVHDIERGTATRVTTKGLNTMPTWTPDGQRVAFASNRTGSMLMYWKRADGSGEAELLRSDDVTHDAIPRSFTPDGAVLVFDQPDPGFDSWTLSMDGRRHAEPLLATPAIEASMGFSPDGRWLAYYSDVSGGFEVYVQPYPGPGRRWMISTEGGTEPVWSADGRELFYRQGHQMMVVDMMADSTFAPGKPRRLFDGYETNPWGVSNYAVSRDGERFLMVQRERRQAPSQLHVVLDWFEELERRVPSH